MGQDEGKFQEIFDRLRETEAQTREQNALISSLIKRIDDSTTVTDRFFELEDKRHQDDERRFVALCESQQKLIDSSAAREEKMWKIIVMFAGALIAVTIGPKVAKEIFPAAIGGDGKPVSCVTPAIPMPQNDIHPLRRGRTGGMA